MSYQRIATPRIYIDNINWLISSGLLPTDQITSSGASMASGSSIHSFFDMKPSNTQTITTTGASAGFKLHIDTNMASGSQQDSNFIAILGHNLKSAGAKIMLQSDDSSAFASPSPITSLTSVVNAAAQADTDTGTNIAEALDTSKTGVDVESGHGGRFSEGDFIKVDSEIMYVDSVSSDTLTCDRGVSGTTAATHDSGASLLFTGYTAPATNGWTLATFSKTSDNRYIRLIIDPDGAANDNFSANVQIGAILIGETMTLPQSPDLSITKQFLFDGVTRQTSIGGQTYANAQYTKSANWISEPFYNYTGTASDRRDKSGRMSLGMGFSYLTDTDVFAEDLYSRTGVSATNSIYTNLISKTNNGMFPMLFQYDSDTATDIDSFLWCRLNNEPSFQQVANRVWSTKIELLEEF
jgi:hypothetical protein|tara:strand:+ start:8911 stop:10140 length:1230 start_codon:yes stop_codon:yes gene_type:complete